MKVPLLTTRPLSLDAGLLLLRLAAGGTMLLAHGLGKALHFSEQVATFPALVGSSSLSLGLAVFAEVFCAGLVVVGLATRLACVPLIITMVVAAFVVHWADPFPSKELAMLYLMSFLTLVLAGPGRLSADALLTRGDSR